MADCDSSLPIRSEADGSDSRVHVKIYDGTTSPSVNAVEVDADNNLHIEIHGNDPSGNDVVGLHSELGHYAIDGIYNATNNTDPSNIGIVVHTRNSSLADAQQTFRTTGGQPNADDLDPANIFALDVNTFPHIWDGTAWDRTEGTDGAMNVYLTNAVDIEVDGVYDAVNNTDPDNVGLIGHVRNATPGDTHQTNRLTSIQNDTVIALDVSMHDEAGAPYSLTNPLPVTIADAASGSTDVHDPQTTDNVVRNATTDHDYTVTAGKTLYLKQWKAIGSGKIKAVLQVETGVGTDTFIPIDWDYNSTSDPSVQTTFAQPIEVGAGIKVRITLTNRDYCTFDVFSWINGYEI